MPPTSNERESSKSPTGSHSIDDILGLKASQMATSQRQATYSGSDSSSDSSSNSASEPDTSPPFPLENSGNSRQLQVATIAGGSQGELNSSAMDFIAIFSLSLAVLQIAHLEGELLHLQLHIACIWLFFLIYVAGALQGEQLQAALQISSSAAATGGHGKWSIGFAIICILTYLGLC